jgi:elongation factor P
MWHFMNTASYEQVAADAQAIGDASSWLKEQDMCTVTLWNGAPISVVPPNFVVMTITETDPGVRGDTASGATKPATVETGAVIKVPLFVDRGELVRIDTRTGAYVSRVKE